MEKEEVLIRSANQLEDWQLGAADRALNESQGRDPSLRLANGEVLIGCNLRIPRVSANKDLDILRTLSALRREIERTLRRE